MGTQQVSTPRRKNPAISPPYPPPEIQFPGRIETGVGRPVVCISRRAEVRVILTEIDACQPAGRLLQLRVLGAGRYTQLGSGFQNPDTSRLQRQVLLLGHLDERI